MQCFLYIGCKHRLLERTCTHREFHFILSTFILEQRNVSLSSMWWTSSVSRPFKWQYIAINKSGCLIRAQSIEDRITGERRGKLRSKLVYQAIYTKRRQRTAQGTALGNVNRNVGVQFTGEGGRIKDGVSKTGMKEDAGVCHGLFIFLSLSHLFPSQHSAVPICISTAQCWFCTGDSDKTVIHKLWIWNWTVGRSLNFFQSDCTKLWWLKQ